MARKQDFRTFARRDASGQIIAGSTINRKKKPKFGNYFEINSTYECCGTTTTTTTVGG